jgi:hypothetical protein
MGASSRLPVTAAPVAKKRDRQTAGSPTSAGPGLPVEALVKADSGILTDVDNFIPLVMV